MRVASAPCPSGGGVAEQKIAVFPAAPCRLVGSGEELARPRGRAEVWDGQPSAG